MQYTGLTREQVAASRQAHGANEWADRESPGFFSRVLAGFGDPMIKILLVALAVNLLMLFAHFDWFEPLGVGVAILMATVVSALSEHGSQKAFAKLQEEAAAVSARVIREGRVQTLSAAELVVGDIVCLQAGDKLPADGVLLGGSLSIDQSPLTGESREIEKKPVYQVAPPLWQTKDAGLLFGGCLTTGGQGIMRVERVGEGSTMGQLAQQLQEQPRPSPLTQRLRHLAGAIGKFGYCAAIAVFLVDIFVALFLRGGFSWAAVVEQAGDFARLTQLLLHALTLAVTVVVVAVPEGLPMMITVVLGRNMRRMLRQNVLVRKLVGIETAGSMSLLLTDKTGTLTVGKLKVAALYGPDGAEADQALRARMHACFFAVSAAAWEKGKATGGNATDRALLAAAMRRSGQRPETTARIPFDSVQKWQAVMTERGAVVVGAPEVLLAHAGGKRTALQRRMAECAAKSMRLVAVAVAPTLPEKGRLGALEILGIVALEDGLRRGVPAAMRDMDTAGIQVVMVTGDRTDTARAVAAACRMPGLNHPHALLTSADMSQLTDAQLAARLPHLRVVARALPGDKARLVRVAQGAGHVVGMTGDGVNDAAALKISDIGFCMGSGTAIAREASDIVILDDSFASIPRAVAFGRTIFSSIRKFLVFQLTMNVAAVAVSVLCPLVGMPAPITIMQMLWLNIIMDTLAGLAFAGEMPLRDTLRRPPIEREAPVLTGAMKRQVMLMAAMIVTLCLALSQLPVLQVWLGLWGDEGITRTAFFTLFIFCGISGAFCTRTTRVNLLAGLRKNATFILIMGAVGLLQLALVFYGGPLFATTGLAWGTLRRLMLLACLMIPLDLARKLLRGKSRRAD